MYPPFCSNGQSITLCTTGEWAEIEIENIVVIHFSGHVVDPMKYLHLKPDKVQECVKEHFHGQDMFGRMSKAVAAWCTAVHNFRRASEQLGREHAVVRKVLNDVMDNVNNGAAEQHKNIHTTSSTGGNYCQNCWHVPSTWWWPEYKYLCEICSLESYCRKRRAPHLKGLSGEWLDLRRGLPKVLTVNYLQVVLDEYTGHITSTITTRGKNRAADDEINVQWDSDESSEWSLSGKLVGCVIDFSNGACWLKIPKMSAL